MLQENLATLQPFLPGPILSLPCPTYLSDNSHASLSSFSSLSGPCDFSLDRHGNHSGQHPYSPAPPQSPVDGLPCTVKAVAALLHLESLHCFLQESCGVG